MKERGNGVKEQVSSSGGIVEAYSMWSIADVIARWWWCWWFTAGRKSERRTYYYHAAQLQRNFSLAATASAGLLIEADLWGLWRLGGPVNYSAARWDIPTREGSRRKGRRGATGERRRGSTQGWGGWGSSGGKGKRDVINAGVCIKTSQALHLTYMAKWCRAGRTDRI